MNYKAYTNRTFYKFEQLLGEYKKRTFREIGRADTVYGMETMEHLRVPPEYSEMKPIEPGTEWGCEYGNIWLRTEYTVPDEADGEILCAVPDAEAKEILCFKNGKPAGIINSMHDFVNDHPFMFVTPDAKKGEHLDIAFECYAWHGCLGESPLSHYGANETEVDQHQFRKRYNGIRFLVIDRLMKDFLFDLTTVMQLAKLPEGNTAQLRAHDCLMEAFPYFIEDVEQADPDELHEACAKVREILAPALEKTGSDRSRGYVGLIGHSHMDTAWLWPMDETIRKCARTYSQTLTLMDMYPEYTFIQSSSLHLDWMREYYPSIFEGIRQKVAEGRYEPNGGVWVECDCNITGGEAMVRQFLYGQRYTQKYLNYRSDAFWLPDTFGYNGAIPQIMLGCGVKYFYTTKISWCDLNNFPVDTFRWRGIDGSEVLTHLNRMHLVPDVSSVTQIVAEIHDKNSNDRRLGAYGFGDGGGGPTYSMLEYVKRVTDLPGMPEVKTTTVSDFMKGYEDRRDKLPVFDDELYLEFHRGTLTTMHEIKKNNRTAENEMYNMELFNVISGEETNEKRDSLYRILLQNQFHDILPGTCIPKVYERTIPEMRTLITDLKAETMQYAEKLAQENENTVSFFNTLSYDRCDPITLDGAHGVEGADAQVYTDFDGNEKTVFQSPVPAMEAIVKKLREPCETKSAFVSDGDTLETPFYHVVFAENGTFASLIDKRVNRELRNPDGEPLGTLWLGESMPTSYDNWELEDDAFKKLKAIAVCESRELVSDGAVEYRIRTSYRIGRKSSAVVDTVFYAADPRIDFEMKLDWHERHRLFKVGFDVALRASKMKNEIQFGHIERPTTRNNSFEAAKFEVCNHTWTDLSETRYGVAILNDCKYGISCENGHLRLTLHNGGTRPDPVTDVGVQTMRYSLLPHVGPFDADKVVKPAHAFNIAPIAVPGILRVPKLFSVSAPNVLCSAVKNAEDIPGAFVLRLYECERTGTGCEVTIPSAKRVFLTNMLEEVIEELPVTDGKVSLSFRAFEIKTLLIER